MGQTKGDSLCALLHRSAKTVGLAFRGDSGAHTREKRSGHAKDVGVEAVRMNDVDFFLSNEMNETTKLPDKVEIVEAVERVFVDLSDSQLIRLRAQRATILQTGEINATLSAVMQLTQKLHRLALAPTLLETIYHESLLSQR
jgi:hypothetical protein